MTREEFIEKLGYSPIITDEEWRIIEFVYTHHPVIRDVDGKQQITDLFRVGGMAVIRDMHERAVQAQSIEKQIENTLSRILTLQHNASMLEEQLNNLRDGCELEDYK